jgi:hypothetical protein
LQTKEEKAGPISTRTNNDNPFCVQYRSAELKSEAIALVGMGTLTHIVAKKTRLERDRFDSIIQNIAFKLPSPVSCTPVEFQHHGIA